MTSGQTPQSIMLCSFPQFLFPTWLFHFSFYVFFCVEKLIVARKIQNSQVLVGLMDFRPECFFSSHQAQGVLVKNWKLIKIKGFDMIFFQNLTCWILFWPAWFTSMESIKFSFSLFIHNDYCMK